MKICAYEQQPMNNDKLANIEKLKFKHGHDIIDRNKIKINGTNVQTAKCSDIETASTRTNGSSVIDMGACQTVHRKQQKRKSSESNTLETINRPKRSKKENDIILESNSMPIQPPSKAKRRSLRTGSTENKPEDFLRRSKRSINIDNKHSEDDKHSQTSESSANSQLDRNKQFKHDHVELISGSINQKNSITNPDRKLSQAAISNKSSSQNSNSIHKKPTLPAPRLNPARAKGHELVKRTLSTPINTFEDMKSKINKDLKASENRIQNAREYENTAEDERQRHRSRHGSGGSGLGQSRRKTGKLLEEHAGNSIFLNEVIKKEKSSIVEQILGYKNSSLGLRYFFRLVSCQYTSYRTVL